MPLEIIKKYAALTGKSIKKVEDLYDQAKEITSETFGVSERNFSDREYSYTQGVLKNMLGIKESYLRDFLDYKGDVSQFLEMVVSSQFASDDVVISPKKKDEEYDTGDEDAGHVYKSDDDDDFQNPMADPGVVLDEEEAKDVPPDEDEEDEEMRQTTDPGYTDFDNALSEKEINQRLDSVLDSLED
ncbi:MAG: hypothetical protein GF311_28425 [Candidatus Lokiarchaeota archaeon]|nr:hypothetical protein [Candidatus Lokiarchaeota archaeon]